MSPSTPDPDRGTATSGRPSPRPPRPRGTGRPILGRDLGSAMRASTTPAARRLEPADFCSKPALLGSRCGMRRRLGKPVFAAPRQRRSLPRAVAEASCRWPNLNWRDSIRRHHERPGRSLRT